MIDLLRPTFKFAVVCMCTLGIIVEAAAEANVYKGAIEHSKRLPGDAKYDATRKPLETLQFSQIKKGDVVVELGAGGGYTTELLSWVVGPEGKVYAHFLYNQDRLKDSRLSNVVSLRQHHLEEHQTVLNEQPLAREGLDAVVIFYILHDIYLNNEMSDELLLTLFNALKPGGKLIVLDNAARLGSGLENIGDLHRIDESFVKQVMLKAGFILEGTLQSLRNPEDDHSKPWGEFGGNQDRFGFRFVKPE